MSTDYVCGFAYSPRVSKASTTTHVLLLKKKAPPWMAGMLNGVGGKIEEGETIVRAMVREFREETGVSTLSSHWAMFHAERYVDGSRVFFLHSIQAAAALQAAVEATSLTDEPCQVVEVAAATGVMMTRSKTPLIYNLRYLLMMSRTFITLAEDLPEGAEPTFDVDPSRDVFPLQDREVERLRRTLGSIAMLARGAA